MPTSEGGQSDRKAYRQEYYRRNRDRLLAAQKERSARADPEEKRAYRRAYYAANRERLLREQRERGRRNYAAKPESYATRGRRSRLRVNFDLTPEQYDKLLAEQGGGCAICGTPPEAEGRRHPVDHCHTAGTVRGILCGNCNRALGLFRDDPELLTAALAYLTRSSSGATSTTSNGHSNEDSKPAG